MAKLLDGSMDLYLFEDQQFQLQINASQGPGIDGTIITVSAASAADCPSAGRNLIEVGFALLRRWGDLSDEEVIDLREEIDTLIEERRFTPPPDNANECPF